MSKVILIALSVLIAVGILASGAGVALAWSNYCPGSLSGAWWSFTPSSRVCSSSYYTYNTTSLGSEESWYKSAYSINVYCNKGTPPYGPTYYYNIGSREYIPSPDNSQTNTGAHYYRWGADGSYGMIGNIAQYSTYGWGYNYTTTWNWHNKYKLSDWTNDSRYSKHVDLDAFGFNNCP
jgi:hypothetical protein